MTVSYGKDQTVTYAADTGYELKSVLVDGNDVTETNPDSYTFEVVTDDHSIEVTYQKPQLNNDLPDEVTITVTDGTNPIEDAYVELTSTQLDVGSVAGVYSGYTDENGQLLLSDCVIGYRESDPYTTTYSLTVSANGYITSTSESVAVTDDCVRIIGIGIIGVTAKPRSR